jgi:lysophospholipase L1-like esterase
MAKNSIVPLCFLFTWVCLAQAGPPQELPPPPITNLQRQMERLQNTIHDYGNLARYHDDDLNVSPPAPGENRVVFMGDSITDFWGQRGSAFFPGKPYVNRGISGQVTPQMLIRFRQDVIDLKPKVVVILAGTNDIGGSVGPIPEEATKSNLVSMVELAQANDIRVVLSSLTPVCDSLQPQTTKRPPGKILALNGWLRSYAAGHKVVYLDYYPHMTGDNGLLRPDLTVNCLHPNQAGYAIMAPLAEQAIKEALQQ